MKWLGLRAIAPKHFKPQTSDSRHGLAIAANLLQNGANAPTAKGTVLVGGITYLRRDGRFFYLATVQDKFTRRIVGWKMWERMTALLVIEFFNQARRRGLIGKGTIIHMDQGNRYAAVEYRRLLYIGGFRQSMRRKSKDSR